MATTWIDQKTDKPAISWGLTLVNSIKAKSARHHNTFPLLKIAALALTCIILMFLYVLYVNKASTAGYFFRVESRAVEAIQFDHNLVKLDVLERQEILWDKASSVNARSDVSAVRDRLIRVPVYTDESIVTNGSEELSNTLQ